MKNSSEASIDRDIDLLDIVKLLWSEKVTIVATTVAVATLSVFFALSIPNTYVSSALLAPADDERGALDGLMSRYGGLATIAGTGIVGGNDSSKEQYALELIKSRGFVGEFVERRGILPDLFAARDWEPASKAIRYDNEVYNPENGEWVRDVSPPLKAKPSPQEAYSEFMRLLSIENDLQTGFVNLSIEHVSPVVAERWVRWLIEDINEKVRQQDVEEASRSIEYLERQISGTPLADLQAIFFELIQSQTETIMLAEVRREYVFKTLDAAVVPEKKSKPNRALICILGAFFGVIMGITFAYWRRIRLRANLLKRSSRNM